MRCVDVNVLVYAHRPESPDPTGATGNRVTDAALAAISLEQGATFVTADHGFARYEGRRVDIPV